RGVSPPVLLRWCAGHRSRGDLVPNEVPVRCEFFGASRSAEFVDRLAQEADSGFDVLEVDGSEAEAEEVDVVFWGEEEGVAGFDDDASAQAFFGQGTAVDSGRGVDPRAQAPGGEGAGRSRCILE